jgi:CBS domain containing-hemolysin-like protein
MAAADLALHGTSELRAKELAAQRGQAGRRVLRQKTEREHTAAALRLGSVLTGFLAAGLGALAPPRMLELTRWAGSSWVQLGTPLLGVLLVALLAASLDVAFRTAATRSPESWALSLSGLVRLVSLLLLPLARVMLVALNLVLSPFNLRARFESPPLPLEELEKLLTAQAAKNEVDQSAPKLIRSIFELSDKRCRDVMVSRTDVVAVDITTPAPEILRLLAEENHSRIPVYKDDIDHIIGVLHARDLIPFLQHPELIVLHDVIRPVHFVPWVKSAGDLLRDMQRLRIHMAMVVDEYGGFMGIVTLEDILREIVGDIADEFDVEERPYEKQPDGSFLVDAGLAVDDFQTAFGFSLPEGDYETLGGYLSSLSGSIPEVGDHFTFNGWQFTVQSKEGARLERVRLARVKVPAVVPTPVMPILPSKNARPS